MGSVSAKQVSTLPAPPLLLSLSLPLPLPLGVQKSFLSDFPLVRFKRSASLSVLPLSCIFVGMVTFNNICLQYVQVPYSDCILCMCNCIYV
ncbi:hypothetical protein EON63_08140 [archaeon]|nr:MAG: hypothetical protein EON63_08140 [archaeon]